MKKVGNYFIDEENNQWSIFLETLESAIQKRNTLMGCTDCTDCMDCMDCTGCTRCTRCTGCMDCTDCTGCRRCTSCTSCTGCTDFKTNPQRIVSDFIGSRKSQTTIYWNEQKEQVVCGCFEGTIQEFEERVKRVHINNSFAQEYLIFIEKVKQYKS